MPKRFQEASETLTPLQGRVLRALETDCGYSPDEVAERAELGRWERKKSDADGMPSWEYVGPDRITTRNVLGWLASKGLAKLVESRWWRVFPSENATKLHPTLSSVDPARIGSDDGRRAQGAKSSPAVLRKAA